MSSKDIHCPHCGNRLEAYEPSPFSDWDSPLLICNNNECSYFTKGREKICEDYKKNFSYRYCVNTANGTSIPMMAWCYGELSLLKGRCNSDQQA
jgi:hypothetical protein